MNVSRRLWQVLGMVALLALPFIITDRYFLHLVVMAGVFVILTSSWNLLTGYAGQMNLGHAAFYGIGAYASALLCMKLGISPWITLFLGGAVSACFGLLLGIPALRLSGPYLAITTIGFAEILRLVAMNWVGLTRGSLGLYGIPPLTPITLGGLNITFHAEQNSYYVVLGLIFLTVWSIRRFTSSAFGISLRAMRDDEIGAASIGININRYKLAVFTLSAFLAGVAGAFLAHYQRLVSPETLSLGETFTVLTMTMLGGLGTIAGPIIGAVLLTFLSEGLRFVEDAAGLDIRYIIYGLLLILTILFMHGGVVGLWERLRQGLGSAKGEG